MNKLAYIRYSQKEANQKIWHSLMDKYKLLKKKNTIIAFLWFFIACIVFGFVAIFSWISFLTLLFKDISFTPHYLRTSIETSDMSQEEIIQYLDTQYSDYKTKLSFGNIPLEKQKQIEATFEIMYKQYKIVESDKKHEEIISNFQKTNQEVQNIGKNISDNINEIKQQTISISQYTDKKQAEEAEIEIRKIEKAKKQTSRYKRGQGRNLDSFESALSDKQIEILVKYCNDIPVFNIDVTQKEMNDILSCTHTRPLQTTVNKYLALLFEELSKKNLICKTWKSVAMNHKCFISPNGKELTSKDLSSANAASGIIKPEVNDLIEECIKKIEEA
jgi:hypothetical protein